MTPKTKSAQGETREGYHQHLNGGGWVKDGLTVADNVYVGRLATLRGGIFHGGDFHGGDFHGGYFRGGIFHGGDFHGGIFHGGIFHGGIFHGGIFHGGEWTRSPLQIQGSLFFLHEQPGGKVQVGCQCRALTEWREQGAHLAKSEGLTPAQVEEHLAYLDLFERVLPLLPPIKEAEIKGAN